MSILTWIEEKKRLKLLNAPKYVNPTSDQSDLLSDGAPRGGRSSKGLWTRCDKCGVILYIKHLKENQRVCFGCTYHLQMSSQERIENLLDKESWRPFDETVSPCDPLEFHDQRNYTDRLRDAQDKTGLQDAIQTGTGLVDGIPVALGIMDFDFMGGSMGSVVGEKITRLIEYATQEGLTLLLVCASGGARMQEGVFSLMQMAKISSALQIYQSCANLLYISILTSPTTGGVTASFAMLGDIIFAEPKALIAFAGRRVIEQTLCEDLPEDFQTSEYMLHHGLVDLIVPRRFLRQALSESIRLYKNAPFKKPGRIPFGVQNPISFLTEEKLRRQCRTELDLDITRSRQLTKSLDLVQTPPGPLLQAPTGPGRTKPSVLLAKRGSEAKHVVDFGLANSSNALTDQSRASNQPSVGSGRSVRQEAGTTFRLGALSRSETAPASVERNVVPARQSVEYREILTSFQMMYQLFSKQLSNGVFELPSATFPALEKSWIKDKNILPEPAAGAVRSGGPQRGLNVESVEEQSILELAETAPAAVDQNEVPVATLSRSESNQSGGQKGVTTGSTNENFGVGPSGQTRAKLELPKDISERGALAQQLDSSLLQKFRELGESEANLVFQTESFSRPEVLLQAPTGPGLAERGSDSAARSAEQGPEAERSSNSSEGARTISSDNFTPGIRKSKLNTRSTLSNNRDFLNQALELAATESVEWRAFYVHQTISKTTGFLEDFLSPDQYTDLLGSIGSHVQTEGLFLTGTDRAGGRFRLPPEEVSSDDLAARTNHRFVPGPATGEQGPKSKVSTSPVQLQNTLFYKSICRTTIR